MKKEVLFVLQLKSVGVSLALGVARPTGSNDTMDMRLLSPPFVSASSGSTLRQPPCIMVTTWLPAFPELHPFRFISNKRDLCPSIPGKAQIHHINSEWDILGLLCSQGNINQAPVTDQILYLRNKSRRKGKCNPSTGNPSVVTRRGMNE